MEAVQIRPATPLDAEGIATVHVKMWQKAYRGQMPDEYLDRLSIDEKTKGWEKMLKDLDDGVFAFVATSGDQVVGWITGGKNRDKDMPHEVGELGGIYVHPDHAGHGVGVLLMHTLLEKLRDQGYKKATLWVLDTNERTRSWYEKHGWRVEGGTKVDHRDGFDLNEVRYVLDLRT